jgi:hypothetical protein
MKTIYTIKRGDYGSFVAHILTPNSATPSQMFPYEDIQELHAAVKEQYGEDAQRVSTRQFDEVAASRQVHSPAICTLLSEFSEIMGEDLSQHVVYGSPMRPMTAAWAHIPDAVYMPADKAATGYHTYVAVPRVLSSDTVNSYELTFVSRPGDAA